MKVASIMTPAPVCVTPETSLDKALELMDEHGFRHLPVLEGETVVGVVTDRDLLRATGMLPRRVHDCRGPGAADNLPRKVGEIMSRSVARVRPDDDMLLAARVLREARIGCVPIIRDGALVGILTEKDLLRMYSARLAERGAAKSSAEQNGSSATVSDCMTPDPRTIHWYTSVGDASEICQTNGVRHLPVLEADRLVGMVSDRDLRRALGRGFDGDTPVEEVMTRNLVLVGPSTPMEKAANAMLASHISCLPVVRDDHLVGILTTTDVLDHFIQVLRAQSDEKAE